MAWLQDWAYSLSDEAVWVHLYGSNVLECEWNGSPIKLAQETNYPWDSAIKITVEQAPIKAMALKVRIPAWTDCATLSVNGQVVEAMPGSYASITRAWADGDVIELNLEMAPRLIEASPLIEEARNQVAVVRGPMVYCIEQSDLSDGVPIDEVAISVEAKLSAEFDADLLGGLVVVKTKGLWRKLPDFDGGLYAPVNADKAEPVDVRFIPYYAWWNRGNQAMTVWLPRA